MKDFIGKILLKKRIKVVLPHIQGKALDIGCGTNELLKKYDGESTGVDVYPWEGSDLVVENTAKLPFEDGEYDTACIIAALNHIPNRLDVLKETHRILKKDGILLITMIPPGISRVWHFLRSPWDADQKERGMIEGEVFGLTPKQIIELLKESGFVIKEEKRFMLGINKLSIAEKIEAGT